MPTVDEDISMRADFTNQVEKDQCIRIFDGVNTEDLFKKKKKEVIKLQTNLQVIKSENIKFENAIEKLNNDRHKLTR
jgi:hypothetical protein